MTDITQILHQIEAGDPSAAKDLLPLVYDELRKLAAVRMAQESADHTLQATALVHEAYLRLVGGGGERRFADRRHFFAAAATAIRRILVDAARAKNTKKRSGGRKLELFTEIPESAGSDELLALDEALSQLASEDPLKAQIVELLFFAGMTGDQTADILGISPSTVDRHWAFARAWLQTQVRGA